MTIPNGMPARSPKPKRWQRSYGRVKPRSNLSSLLSLFVEPQQGTAVTSLITIVLALALFLPGVALGDTLENRIQKHVQELLLKDLSFAQRLLGVWHEREGDAVYKFRKDHEFQYEDVLAGKQRKAYGVWESRTFLCSLREGGNLMIHYETYRCCHRAYFLGKNLILSKVGAGSPQLDWLRSTRRLCNRFPLCIGPLRCRFLLRLGLPRPCWPGEDGRGFEAPTAALEMRGEGSSIAICIL